MSCNGLITKQGEDTDSTAVDSILSDQTIGQSVTWNDYFKADIQNGKVEIEFLNVGSEAWNDYYCDQVPYKEKFELKTQMSNPEKLQIEFVGEGEAPYLFVFMEDGYVESVSLWALATSGKTYTSYISKDGGIENIIVENEYDCSIVYGETADGTRTDLLEQYTDRENKFVAKVTDFITDMYNNAKYIDYDFLEANCTENLLQCLEEDYDYDKEPGQVCYAVWEFRSDANDGNGDEYGIESVMYRGDNLFDYHFIDAGEYGCHTLKIVEVGNGKFLMDILIKEGGAG